MSVINESYTTVKHAIQARYTPSYAADHGTGYCRLSNPLFKQLGINIGWILEIALNIDCNNKPHILCTAWPDSANILDDNHLCVDDTVIATIGSTYWAECVCEVLNLELQSVSPFGILLICISAL